MIAVGVFGVAIAGLFVGFLLGRFTRTDARITHERADIGPALRRSR